ncbi:MAG: hypothetical protein IT480_04245 [Gammaproteobacteria bacterium]|nr:hypothetical protein [Gammaproteobacteria bacterium]
MGGKQNRGARPVTADEIARLLIPQVRFLRAAGVPFELVEQVLRAEFRRKIPKTKMGRVEHVQFNNQCARLIANWKVLSDYLNPKGYPRDLPLKGRRGFIELSKLSAPGVRPADLLKLLVEFGSVVKMRSGLLRLRTRAFLAKAPASQAVAFEPNMQFLVDCAHVIQDQLNISTGRRRDGIRFWRAVDNHWIPERYVQSFMSFSKRRGMELMEEIEDWLDEHEISRESGMGKKLRRLGVGVFSVSDPSTYSL